MAIRNLDKILLPNCIAVVGASNQPECMSYEVLKNVRRAGFEGAIYPVHPHEGQVQGLRAFPSLAALPEPADLAIVCAPAETVPEIVRQAGEAGVGGMLITSPGFREIGEGGADLERQFNQAAQAFPQLRILGPNSLGIVPHRKLNASFAAATPKPGSVAFVSQSGTLCNSALDWAIQEEIGFSCFVSIGNMGEVGVGDLIDYFAADPFTDSIILYVESITDARQFMSAARAITQEKPIVVYKAGRYSESAEAAASHTGSICGVDEVYAAAFERAGIVRVFDIDDMFDVAQLLARKRPLSGPRLAIITNAGGPGVVATDSLIDRKGHLARLSDQTLSRLNEVLPPYWSHANPVDLLDDAPPDRFARALEIVLKDRGVDAALVILTPQSMTDSTATAQAVAKIAQRSLKPVLASWMGGGAVRGGLNVLNQAEVPAYSSPRSAVHAFMHMISYAKNRETLYETPRDVPLSSHQDHQRQKELLCEALAAEQPELSEPLSKQLLAGYGIRATDPRPAADAEEAVSRAREIGYPVVLKIISPQISHKNEVGGVALNVATDQDVRVVFDRICELASGHRPDAEIQGVSVQPMIAAPDGIELIMGSRKDAVFGAVILIGMGGVAAEVHDDFALGLPPLNERLARRMLESLRAWPILAGLRQRPPAAIEQLTETLIRFSYLVANVPQIAEIDVNPLLVTPRNVIALDARMRIDPSHPPGARPFSHLAIRPYPEELARPITLRDGTSVVLRPIRPEDEPLWHEMLAACSLQSIRLRFRAMFKEMSHEVATRFCFMDYDRELAMVAELTAEGKRTLIGVGHLLADPDHTRAELAVLVPDSWQRRGVGSLITETCLQVAADWGLRVVDGETECTNSGMIATFKKAGFEIHHKPGSDVVRARKGHFALSGLAIRTTFNRPHASMTLLYYDPVFLEHKTGNHPETHQRLEAVAKHLQWVGLDALCRRPVWKPISSQRLALVHSLAYAERVKTFIEHGGGWIEHDTFVSPRSYDVALMAAGAVCDAVERVVRGEDKRALCLVRPPGHHALPGEVMGFCLFNNVALGARLAAEEFGLDRVLVVDWDVHHGNGTQAAFWEDDRVGFLSIHRFPFYPGSGEASETGAGRGLGTTLNLPVAWGTPPTDYMKQFELELGRFADKIRPQLVLISAGFDAHREDPVGSLGLETEDFRQLTRIVMQVANEHAAGSLVSVLEGGYNPGALSDSVDAHLDELLAD